MSIPEIVRTLIAGWAQQAALETVSAGIAASEVVTAYYFTVSPDAPEDDVQAMISSYEGYVAQEMAQRQQIAAIAAATYPAPRRKQTETRVGKNVTQDRKDALAKGQADRRKRLTAAAKQAGYTSIDKLAEAILTGKVVITKAE